MVKILCLAVTVLSLYIAIISTAYQENSPVQASTSRTMDLSRLFIPIPQSKSPLVGNIFQYHPISQYRCMINHDTSPGCTIKHHKSPLAVEINIFIPLWCTQVGLSPWKIKWNQGGPGYWPPKCKNKIRGVQPHMLRKEKIMKIISHPTEGFAKIKSRGSRNKIKKVPSQHPKCSRNKTEGVQGQPMCLWNQLKNPVTTKQSIDSIYSNHTTQQNSTSLGTLDFIFPKIYQIFNPNISKPSF